MPNIVVCLSCTDDSGEKSNSDMGQAILDALNTSDMKDCFTLSYVDCMGACATPSAIALQGDGLATFLFSGLSITEDIDDIVKTCRTYLDSPNGWIQDAQSCGRLKYCLHARIPGLYKAVNSSHSK